MVERRSRHVAWTGLAWLLILILPTPVAAAAGDNEAAGATTAAGSAQPAERDFLFGRPRTVVGIAGGWLVGTERGELFDFIRDELTVEDGDFDTGAVRFLAGRAVAPRLDLLAEVGVSRATVLSEYREFVDIDDLPIPQTTEFTRVPVGGSLRLWLVPRGREIGRFAWVPTRVAPYVGVGGGGQWYRFLQFGDFVDFVDLGIFSEAFESSGWAWSGHLFGGASIMLTRQLFLTIEARQHWARTPLSNDYVGFEDIELDGLRITAGLEFVF